MTAFEPAIKLNRVTSVAAMQEWCGFCAVAGVSFFPAFGGTATKPVGLVPTERVFNRLGGVDRFQSACNMLYNSAA